MFNSQNITPLVGKADSNSTDLLVKGELFPPRKVWIKTYGCQMNYHDTERMLYHLKGLNFKQTLDQDEADLMIFNTCAIRDLANQKFYSHLGNTKRHKKTNKEIKIAASGCIAQTDSKELLKKYPQLDFVFGTDVIDNIGEMVFRTYMDKERFALTSWDRADNYSIDTKVTSGEPRAFVNIIKGCDKFCSYCIVPFTRGREKSRSITEIYNDVARLVTHQGIQEVTLLGQNVNSFGKKNGESLAELIMELERIEGLKLIRYTTSHPYDISDELIEVHGKSKKLSRHLHLPVQSGSNSVLKRMLRQYSIEHYLERLSKLRQANPKMVVSTDIIAGFPNETQKEHEATLKLLDLAQFDFIYSYQYSSRPGTKAARIDDVLTQEIRGARLREIQAHQLKIQESVRKQMEGHVYRVLVDGQSTMKGVRKYKGRTNCSRIVHFIPPQGVNHNLQWHWVDLKITEARALSCEGEMLKDLGKNPSDSDFFDKEGLWH